MTREEDARRPSLASCQSSYLSFLAGPQAGGPVGLNVDVFKYVVAVGLIKLGLGAAAWEAAAGWFDSHALGRAGQTGAHAAAYESEHPLLYLSRALFVGVFDALFCTCGACFAALLEPWLLWGEPPRLHRADALDLAKLWVAAAAVGTAWQYLGDFACGLAVAGRAGFGPSDPTFSAMEVFASFLIYCIVQSVIFGVASGPLLRARWHEKRISALVGMAGFGFYLSGACKVHANIHVLRPLIAGALSSLLALTLAVPLVGVLEFRRRRGAPEVGVWRNVNGSG